jgi:hypothetical protein
VDGELLGHFNEIHFREATSRLRVIAPEAPVVRDIGESLKHLLSWPRRAPAPPAPRTP